MVALRGEVGEAVGEALNEAEAEDVGTEEEVGEETEDR